MVAADASAASLNDLARSCLVAGLRSPTLQASCKWRKIGRKTFLPCAKFSVSSTEAKFGGNSFSSSSAWMASWICLMICSLMNRLEEIKLFMDR